MTPKQFRRYLDRDGGCIHCGETESVAPHHRLNRGMGGSKERDTPANIVVLCSWMNNLLESDPIVADKARENGWKLRPGQNPRTAPIWLPMTGFWALLDDDYHVRNLRGEINANNQTGTGL